MSSSTDSLFSTKVQEELSALVSISYLHRQLHHLKCEDLLNEDLPIVSIPLSEALRRADECCIDLFPETPIAEEALDALRLYDYLQNTETNPQFVETTKNFLETNMQQTQHFKPLYEEMQRLVSLQEERFEDWLISHGRESLDLLATLYASIRSLPDKTSLLRLVNPSKRHFPLSLSQLESVARDDLSQLPYLRVHPNMRKYALYLLESFQNYNPGPLVFVISRGFTLRSGVSDYHTEALRAYKLSDKSDAYLIPQSWTSFMYGEIFTTPAVHRREVYEAAALFLDEGILTPEDALHAAVTLKI